MLTHAESPELAKRQKGLILCLRAPGLTGNGQRFPNSENRGRRGGGLPTSYFPKRDGKTHTKHFRSARVTKVNPGPGSPTSHPPCALHVDSSVATPNVKFKRISPCDNSNTHDMDVIKSRINLIILSKQTRQTQTWTQQSHTPFE